MGKKLRSNYFLIDGKGKLVFDLDYLSDEEIRLMAEVFARENEIRVKQKIGKIKKANLIEIGAKGTG
jgi:hypothetical protein